jgi:1-acyl-sn-glycerol-3-phosphate acyltransferase
MIKCSHNPFVVSFFDWYLLKILKSDFHKIKYDENFSFDKNKSILFIGNHFSWWDGFFTYYLKIKLFKKDFNVMMLEEELKKRILFSYAGVYSIKKKSDTVNESLDYTCELLENPKNLVLMFPQGKIESMHIDKINFEKGLAYILNNAKNFQLIYSSVFIDYFSQRKPVAQIYLKKIDVEKNYSIEELELLYNEHYNDSKSKQNLLYK